MNTQLANKVVLVTGSGSGIGLGVATLCLQRGARVAGVSLEPTPIEHPHCVGFVGDVADEMTMGRAIDAAVARFGRLDGVVCNAGIMTAGSIESLELASMRQHFEVNLIGMAVACKLAFPHLRRAGGGSIVLCSSIMAYTSAPASVAYTVSKTAALGLMRSIAMDGAAHRVRCNAICPGTIDTPLYRRYIDQQPDPAAVHSKFERMFPLGRIGQPTDIAAAAAFLLSDDSAYMTGSELVVDGGYMISGTNE